MAPHPEQKKLREMTKRIAELRADIGPKQLELRSLMAERKALKATLPPKDAKAKTEA